VPVSGEVLEDGPKSAAEPDAFVFTSAEGLPLEATNYRYRIWLKATKEAGFEGDGLAAIGRRRRTGRPPDSRKGP